MTVKVIWFSSVVESDNAEGTSIRQFILENRDEFVGLSVDDAPMKVLRRDEKTGRPTSCVELHWDYVIRDNDEIEFFRYAGVYEAERSLDR